MGARPVAHTRLLSPLCSLRPNAAARAASLRAHGVVPGLSSLSSFMGCRFPASLTGSRTQRAGRTRPGEQCVTRVQRATASFFGVGAPEALLVAVVALVVFGPKGLAEAAASLGRTLRAFQPTVRELADISNELQTTLKKEIGLDEIQEDLRRQAATTTSLLDVGRPPAPPATDGPAAGTSGNPANPGQPGQPQQQMVAVTDDIAQQIDPTIESKRAASAQAAWGGVTPVPAAAEAPAAAPISSTGTSSSSSNSGTSSSSVTAAAVASGQRQRAGLRPARLIR